MRVNIKFFSMFFLVFIALGNAFLCSNSISFGSRNSAIRISDNSTLYLSSSNIIVDEGSLVKDDLGNISGNNLNFNRGIFESNGVESYLTGQLNSAGPDSIRLVGDSVVDVEPGMILEQLYVESSNNKLIGQPLFNNPIVLQDLNTTLTIAIQNRLNKNIIMNGGLLRLGDDLKLADNVKLDGSGRIKLDDRQFSFGSYYDSAWTNDLIWDNAADIVLNGKTELTGEWVFIGESTLNGNGNVLDLTGGGNLRVSPGATLYLVDVHIKGLGSGGSEGKLIGDYNTSQIKIYNSDLEFVSNYTYTSGKFFVDGPSTFIVKDEDIKFENDANLTVDAVTLWLDPLADTIVTDLFAGNLSLINSGTIRTVAASTNSSNAVNGPLTSDIVLNGSAFIHPSERIEVAGNITIDGKGAVLVFADPIHSQFVVRKGYTVTLKNVEFDRLHANTFDLRYVAENKGSPKKWYLIDSQINIAENVVFGLSEDITFSQGLINIIRESDGDPNVFYVKGVDGKNKMRFNPIPNYAQAISNATNDGTLIGRMSSGLHPVLLKLNDNTIGVQFIDLWGIKHISRTITDYIGSIGLVGGSTASFDGVGPYDMNFVVEDLNNEFRLLKDSIKFTGQILFADEGENELRVDVVLNEIINNPADDPNRKIPRIRFGTGCVNLSSMNGRGLLLFTDANIRIVNDANAFVAEENSFLGGRGIEVYGDHIWNFYDASTNKGQFVTEIENLTAPDPALNNIPIISDSVVLSPIFRSGVFRSIPRYQTALHLLYHKKRESHVNFNSSIFGNDQSQSVLQNQVENQVEYQVENQVENQVGNQELVFDSKPITSSTFIDSIKPTSKPMYYARPKSSNPNRPAPRRKKHRRSIDYGEIKPLLRSLLTQMDEEEFDDLFDYEKNVNSDSEID